MSNAVAVLVCAVFVALGLWHFYMACGSSSRENAAVPSVNGKPLFVPSRLLTIVVGVVLLLFAVLVAATSGMISLGLPPVLLSWLSYALALGLFARAIGEFKYVGFFKKVRGSRFARMDTLLYSPLCLLLSVGMVAVAMHPADASAATEPDIVYGEVAGEKLLLDVYRPPLSKELKPAIVLIHGGGWAGGSRKDFRDLASFLAQSGYVCFSLSYRLVRGGANTHPAQLDDVQRGVRWIRANAGRFEIDPDRIAAIGGSAGAHLASLLGMLDTRSNGDAALAPYSSKVNAVVDLFGPADLTVPFPVTAELDVPRVINEFIGASYGERPELYRDASPIFHIDARTAPFLILHGTADPLVPVRQSERFHEALKQAGVEATLIEFEGEGHGFAREESGRKFAAALLTFLGHHLQARRTLTDSGKS